MFSRFRIVLWVCFVLSLFLVTEGIMIRTSNENINKSVIPVADYYDFNEAIISDGSSISSLLAQLSASGIKTVALKELPGISPDSVEPDFDESLMNLLCQQGFEILLRPGSIHKADIQYFNKLDRIIKSFRVKYIIFNGPEITGNPDKLDKMEHIIKDNNIILGIIEPKSQVRYEKQLGLEKLIPACGYSINRVYITPADDLFVLDRDSLFHRWLRGVVDRGIRLVYISPLQNQQTSVKDNIYNTLSAVSKLNNMLSDRRYGINIPLQKMSRGIPGKAHYILVSVNLFITLALYLNYAFSRSKKTYGAFLSAAGLAFIFLDILTVLEKPDMGLHLATIAALIYPALAGTLILSYNERNPSKPFISLLAVSLSILLAISGAGAYTVVTTMSDVRYTMNLESFQAVREAYMVPLVLFAIAYLFPVLKIRSIIKYLKNCIISWRAYFYLLLGVFIIYIYVSRSGNDSLFPATALELWLRNNLEDIFLVRPRLKEFLIGYPCLFTFVFVIRKCGIKPSFLPIGLGMTMVSVSIINSFCHVFTSVAVSTQRTLNGLILGLLTGFVAIYIPVLFRIQPFTNKQSN